MRVSSKFRLRNRFNIGMLLILALSIFVITISILMADGITLAILISLGIFFLILSLAAIAKQFTDFLFVTDKDIVFRNSLLEKTLHIEAGLKVKTSIERKYRNVTRSGLGSSSSEVELFIKKGKTKYRVFDFIMEGKNYKEANYLKKTIAHFIKGKIENAVPGDKDL